MSSPARIEEPGGVEAAGALECGLAQVVGEFGEELALDLWAGRQRRGEHLDLLDRALAADAARRRRVEAPRAGVAEERAGHLDHVAGEVIGEPGVVRPVDQALAVEEPERELLVVARRAHRDRERLAVDADLERLLDRDPVLGAVALDPGVDSCGSWRIRAAMLRR